MIMAITRAGKVRNQYQKKNKPYQIPEISLNIFIVFFLPHQLRYAGGFIGFADRHALGVLQFFTVPIRRRFSYKSGNEAACSFVSQKSPADSAVLHRCSRKKRSYSIQLPRLQSLYQYFQQMSNTQEQRWDRAWELIVSVPDQTE